MSVRLPARTRHVSMDVSLAIVNVVLMLIFFFLVTGQMTVRETGEGLRPAETTELPLDQLPRPLLAVAPGGGWSLNGAPVAPDLLDVALDALPQPVTVNLLIDRSAPAGDLVAVLNHPALASRQVRLVTMHRRAAP